MAQRFSFVSLEGPPRNRARGCGECLTFQMGKKDELVEKAQRQREEAEAAARKVPVMCEINATDAEL